MQSLYSSKNHKPTMIQLCAKRQPILALFEFEGLTMLECLASSFARFVNIRAPALPLSEATIENYIWLYVLAQG